MYTNETNEILMIPKEVNVRGEFYQPSVSPFVGFASRQIVEFRRKPIVLFAILSSLFLQDSKLALRFLCLLQLEFNCFRVSGSRLGSRGQPNTTEGIIKTCRLLELRVSFLRLNQIQDNVKGPGKDERQEQGESGEVHVPLGAIDGQNVYLEHGIRDVLEFASGEISLCPDIGSTLLLRLRDIRFC